MSDIRTTRQKLFAQEWIDKGKFGILHLCPRFGKCRTAINIFNELKPKTILIAYPDNKIKASWQADFEEMAFDDKGVTYTTHLSLGKHTDKKYDMVVIDEIHLLSENQLLNTRELLEKNDVVLGLTGTMTKSTEEELCDWLNLCVVARYPIEKAIEEGIVTDYEITVVRVPLDNKRKNNYKGKMRTEKAQFDSYGWVIDNLERQGKNTMFLRLARMRIIQNSIAKMEKTRELLSDHKKERVLVFCGLTKIADSLGIPSHHSKKGDKEVFENFASGEGNHLAVVRIGNTGVTYKPLNRVIINYFDSNAENLAQKINRCMAMEYNNPDKKARIYIVCSTEDVERKWLLKALDFFDPKKINFV